jgi:hypothetical protein
MRKKPHFLKNIPISRQIRLVFWGRKWQFSFAEKSAKYLRVLEEKSKLRKNLADFSAKKGPLSTPKNESNSKRIWVFFQKMWHFSHPESTILL